MTSRNGRYVLVYNGEVYNYLELQNELEQLGHEFRGTSDTEVLLAAFCQWGLEATLPRLNGMFALALWDRQERRLGLARDRYGKKPLYYGRVGKFWAFASELKALRRLPDFRGTIDRTALGEFFRLAYVPAPYSIYEGIFKLPPASFTWLPSPPRTYWSLAETARHTGPTSIEDIEIALLRSVKRRMISDVPLGAFLSGGIDSSLIVAMMQEQSTRPVRTFSLGFRSASHDEAVFARRVAEHLGTDHTEHYVSPQEALEVVPLLPKFYDEPFADSSQIPTYLVCRMARQHVTVALSGDGGDEVFGGYNRYLFAPRIWGLLRRFPAPLRLSIARFLQMLPLQLLVPLLTGRVAYPQEKLAKLLQLLPCQNQAALYHSLVSQWQQPEQLVGDFRRPDRDDFPPAVDFVDWMMVKDGQTYLPDDILVKVDRASMAVSLEARAPFLDPEVTELAWGLPRHQKIRGREGKVALRQLLSKRIPGELFQRPKAGFSLPLGDWLRGPLRPWAEDLLIRLKTSEHLREKPVVRLWQEHLERRRDWSAALWCVFMFQSWLAEN